MAVGRLDVLQQGAGARLSNTSTMLASAQQPADPALMLQHRRRCELQNLPIARDLHGRSPLQSAELSVRSPARSLPLDSHLLTVSDSCKNRTLQQVQEALTSCVVKSSEAFERAAVPIDSIVACEGSPTARTLRHAFSGSRPAMYALPEAALSALEARQVQRALLPVESSTDGSVHRTFDLLLRYSNVHVVGELVQLQLRRQAAAEEEAVAAAECRRFWVIAKDVPVLPHVSEEGSNQPCSFKTTVAMVLREGLGALHKVLAAFAFRGIRVTNVESRPWRPQPLLQAAAASSARLYFQYVLFVDVENSTASRAMQNALAQLQEHAIFLRLLGSYPCFHTSLSLSPRQSHVAAAPLAHAFPVLPLQVAGGAA